jgi:hypothetical protein
MTVTKQQLLDYSVKTSDDYLELVRSIDEWIAETAWEFQKTGKIRYALSDSDFSKYYRYIKADFELAQWTVNSYRSSDGTYYMEFS